MVVMMVVMTMVCWVAYKEEILLFFRFLPIVSPERAQWGIFRAIVGVKLRGKCLGKKGNHLLCYRIIKRQLRLTYFWQHPMGLKALFLPLLQLLSAWLSNAALKDFCPICPQLVHSLLLPIKRHYLAYISFLGTLL